MRFISKLFNSRINEVNYSMGIAFSFLFYLFIFSTIYFFYLPEYIDFILIPLSVINFLFIISLNTRRAHDLGKSLGELLVEMRITFNYSLPFTKKGQPEENKWGNLPKPELDFKNIFGLEN